MKKIIEKAKHKVKIKEKALKRKVNILGEELGKNISVETVKRFFRYILKGPKRFINKLKNSGNRFSFILDFLVQSKFLIAIFAGILMLKTIFFYNSNNKTYLVYSDTFILFYFNTCSSSFMY